MFISERGAYELIPWLLLIISIMSVFLTRDPKTDYSVIGIYLRMLVDCIIFPSMIVFFLKKKVNVLHILSLVLFLHCLTVLIQLVEPSIQEFNSFLFRFNREDDLLDDYTFRRLGLTGGFDLSALYTVMSVVFALEDYLINTHRQSLFIFIVSFLASLFTSRTGMLISAMAVVVRIYINIKRMKGSLRLASLMILSIAFIAMFFFILPIVLSSFGLNYRGEISGLEEQYATGTISYLFDYQLDPLYSLNMRELLMGYGCGVQKTNRIYGGSDIGYIKQIYQVGIIGVLLIMYFCLSCSMKTYQRFKKSRKSNMDRFSNQLMWLFFLLYCIFNYKNHFMFSVCSFEVFLIVYWSVIYNEIKHHETKHFIY